MYKTYQSAVIKIASVMSNVFNPSVCQSVLFFSEPKSSSATAWKFVKLCR